ncbi:MAG: class I SAM-dependent methyltransferase [Gaiellaceae bacterium]
MSSPEYPEYVARNVAIWTENNAKYTDRKAAEAWARELDWGVFGIPEAELRALGDVTGLDVVELGCGTAYVSAQLARLGARPVGVDPTPAQLETARRMMAETGIEFPLVEAVAESVPLPDASFDLALSEYGASIWADPYRWIPEAARLLRPGGRLVFLRNSTIVILHQSLEGATEQLQRPQRGLCRIEWPDTGEVEFHLPAAVLIDVLRESGFELERVIDLYAPDDADSHEFYDFVTADWARKWPAEEIWVARKR